MLAAIAAVPALLVLAACAARYCCSCIAAVAWGVRAAAMGRGCCWWPFATAGRSGVAGAPPTPLATTSSVLTSPPAARAEAAGVLADGSAPEAIFAPTG